MNPKGTHTFFSRLFPGSGKLIITKSFFYQFSIYHFHRRAQRSLQCTHRCACLSKEWYIAHHVDRGCSHTHQCLQHARMLVFICNRLHCVFSIYTISYWHSVSIVCTVSIIDHCVYSIYNRPLCVQYL